MHVLPQEIEVWYIIPAIRRELAKCLVTKYQFTYDRVGKILGVSKAAIAQYLKNKRASKVKLHEKARQEAYKACGRIVAGKTDSTKEIIRLLELIRRKKWKSEVCGSIKEGKFEDCKELILIKPRQ